MLYERAKREYEAVSDANISAGEEISRRKKGRAHRRGDHVPLAHTGSLLFRSLRDEADPCGSANYHCRSPRSTPDPVGGRTRCHIHHDR